MSIQIGLMRYHVAMHCSVKIELAGRVVVFVLTFVMTLPYPSTLWQFSWHWYSVVHLEFEEISYCISCVYHPPRPRYQPHVLTDAIVTGLGSFLTSKSGLSSTVFIVGDFNSYDGSWMYRKSHMGFQLVPKSVTLNELERRNGRYFAFFSPHSIALGPITWKWLKIDLYSLRQKCSPKNLVFTARQHSLLCWRAVKTRFLSLIHIWRCRRRG